MTHEEKINNASQLLHIHTRYLQKALETQAQYGLATPTHLLVEIEDRKTKIESLKKELQTLENLSDEIPDLDDKPTERVSVDVQKKVNVPIAPKVEIVSLKQLLTKLIHDHLTETTEIEISFDPSRKVYQLMLAKNNTQ